MVQRKSDFQGAQGPRVSLHVADTLTQAAHPIFYSAAEQKGRHDKASDLAYAKAEVSLADDPKQAPVVEIDCEEPAFLPAFLLYGYTIENLLKGLYMLKHPKAEHDQKLRVPALHNLTELVKVVDYALCAAEAELLEN
jgi:hypothetical protein